MGLNKYLGTRKAKYLDMARKAAINSGTKSGSRCSLKNWQPDRAYPPKSFGVMFVDMSADRGQVGS